MVGKITSGQGFSRLGWYLSEKNPERVAWTSTRNTLERDPLDVAQEMKKTARRSDRVKKPVYHVSISADPGDEVTGKQLEQVADQTLKDLGLEDHQAALVAHNDTDHPHVHLMINRVNPDTGKAWPTSNDRWKLKESLERQERELGLRLTGSNARHPEVDREPSRSVGESKETGRTDGKPFADQVRDRALSDFQQATSWGDLQRRLDKRGLKLVGGRERGGVVTDGERRAKLSTIARNVSRAKLDERFGETYKDHQQRDKSMEAQDTDTRPKEVQNHSRSFRQKLEAARNDVQSASDDDDLRQGLKKQGLNVKGSGRDTEIVNPDDESERIGVQDLSSAYRKGRLADRQNSGNDLDDAADRSAGKAKGAGTSIKGKVMGSGDGASKGGSSVRGTAARAGTAVAREALEPMEDESDAMKKAARLMAVAGRVADRMSQRRRRDADDPSDQDGSSENQAEAASEERRERDIRQTGADGLDAGEGERAERIGEREAKHDQVGRAEAAINRHRDQRELEDVRAELSQEIGEAENQLESDERGQSKIEDARRDVDEAVKEAYENPGAVRNNIQRATREQGAKQTAEHLRERPEQFGQMQDASEARDAAARAGKRLEDAAHEMESTPPAAEVQELREATEESREQLRDVEEQMQPGGQERSSTDTRREVGERMAALGEQETEQLKTRIDDEQVDMARDAREEYRTRETKRDVQAYHETQEMEQERRAHTKTITEGEQQLSDDDEVQSKLKDARKEFDDNLRKAYQNPGAAKDEFHERAEETSRREAADVMRKDPEQFGSLNEKQKSQMMGLRSETSTQEARDHAAVAANRGETTRQLEARALSQEKRKSIRDTIKGTKDRQTEITEALENRTSSKALKSRIGKRLAKMKTKGAKKALEDLPNKGAAVAKQALRSATKSITNATRDRDHGHSHGL